MSKNQTTSGAQGTTYEARMCILLFVRGYIRGLKNFTLEYQVPEADKFDDVVFDDGSGQYQIIQLKHKESDTQIKITHSQLFHEKFNTDFNLIKYVQAVINANSTHRFRDKIKAAVVVTNIQLDLKDGKLNLIKNQTPAAKGWFDKLSSVNLNPTLLDDSVIFNMSSSVPEAKYYKFIDDPNIEEILKRQVKTLSGEIQKEKDKREKSDKKDVDIDEDKNAPELEIHEALEKLIFAVQQPNTLKITELIKTDLQDHFKLNNADAIYEKLAEIFRDWCDTKHPLEQPSTSLHPNVKKQHVLTYADADIIFQKNVKKVSFGVTPPTHAFTGRTVELEKVREQLKKDQNLIVCQSVAISGLGGIGKTELTKQFIKQFGKTDFYERVMWIEAESDETVKNSFERLARKLNIQGGKRTEDLIDQVFQYFEGLKVLFVFDNFDKTSVNKGLLVTYCRKSTSSALNDRPFFLFTSRNRECLPGVPLFDLSVLSRDDALQLIMNELSEVNPTKVEAQKLVRTLQCFPLALRQAIAYIKEQHRMKAMFGETYKIKDYIKKFEDETQDLLKFKYPDDFGDYGKTTFITWNVTLNAIKSDKIHGKNAIEILRIFACLYADKIDPKIFLPVLENDEKKTFEAISLLKKYSMITQIEQEGTFYQIHRLVQAVVQLKFKRKDEDVFLEQTCQLIHPKLYHKYFFEKNPSSELMDQCSVDQMFHYNALSAQMMKHKRLKKEYGTFFTHLRDRTLHDVAYNDDIEKMETLKLPAGEFERALEVIMNSLLYSRSKQLIYHFIENGELGVNDKVKGMSLIAWSLSWNSFETLKFLIEKGADFSEVREGASFELISDIIKGNSDALQEIINKSDTTKSEDNQKLINECLFFAIIFNQEAIVQQFERIFGANPQFKKWSLVYVAAMLSHNPIVKILLQKCDKKHLKKCLLQLILRPNFSDKVTFETIFNEYLVIIDADNDQNDTQIPLLLYATGEGHLIIAKLEIINFLLDNDADPFLPNNFGTNAVTNLLTVRESNQLKPDDKPRIDEILNQKILINLTPDKFMKLTVHGLFKIKDWHENQYYKGMFEKLVKEIGGINIRNHEGKTILINYVTDQYEQPNIETVKYLVEHGVDVDIQDHEKKSALSYAFGLENNAIFWYLLTKVNSVDENVLEDAVKQSESRIIETFHQKQLLVNYRFKSGKTLIELAVVNVAPEVVLCLKEQFQEFHEQGGNVNQQDELGQTLLIKLVQNIKSDADDGDLKNVKFLVENGVDVNFRDEDERTGLYYALSLRNDDIFMYLLEQISFVDENILIEAIDLSKASLVEALIPKHFKMDYRFKDESYINKTPLEFAKERKRHQIVKYLKKLKKIEKKLECQTTTDEDDAESRNLRKSLRRMLNDLSCCSK